MINSSSEYKDSVYSLTVCYTLFFTFKIVNDDNLQDPSLHPPQQAFLQTSCSRSLFSISPKRITPSTKLRICLSHFRNLYNHSRLSSLVILCLLYDNSKSLVLRSDSIIFSVKRTGPRIEPYDTPLVTHKN